VFGKPVVVYLIGKTLQKSLWAFCQSLVCIQHDWQPWRFVHSFVLQQLLADPLLADELQPTCSSASHLHVTTCVPLLPVKETPKKLLNFTNKNC
jgi:hypothetical protein